MNKTLGFLILSLGLSGCTKDVETGPCEAVPATYLVSIYDTPDSAQSQFFTRNYKACKTRKLKRDPNALFSVGVSVLHGLGTQKDPMKAFLWFKGAADKHHKNAQQILAQMFMDGVGVPRDPMIAKKYLDVVNHPPQDG